MVSRWETWERVEKGGGRVRESQIRIWSMNQLATLFATEISREFCRMGHNLSTTLVSVEEEMDLSCVLGNIIRVGTSQVTCRYVSGSILTWYS